MANLRKKWQHLFFYRCPGIFCCCTYCIESVLYDALCLTYLWAWSRTGTVFFQTWYLEWIIVWRFSFSSVLRKDKKGAACFVLPAFRWLFLPVMSYTILLRKQPACGGGKGRESTRVGGAGVGEGGLVSFWAAKTAVFLAFFFLLPSPLSSPVHVSRLLRLRNRRYVKRTNSYTLFFWGNYSSTINASTGYYRCVNQGVRVSF